MKDEYKKKEEKRWWLNLYVRILNKEISIKKNEKEKKERQLKIENNNWNRNIIIQRRISHNQWKIIKSQGKKEIQMWE